MSDPLVSKNSMFWHKDPAIDRARTHHGWARFHRQCGQAGLYFDDIEAVGRKGVGGYTALAYRLTRTPDCYHRHLVSNGKGRSPIDALLSAFDGAVEVGFPIDPEIRNLFDPAPTDKLMDALGGPTPPAAPVDDTSWKGLLG